MLLHHVAAFLAVVTTLVSAGSLDMTFNSARALARDCNTVTVPKCDCPNPRDIVFILDTSESMDRAVFYSTQLDFVQSVYCAFEFPTVINRAALVTFSAKIVKQIPLKVWTPVQWFAQVETIRSDPNVCCSCCTPTAEAFDLTRSIFDAAPELPNRDGLKRLAFLLTDGAPYQNSNGPYAYPGMDMGTYMTITVPTRAQALKRQGTNKEVRLITLGIPNSKGVAPREKYFKGIPDPLFHLCGGPANRQGYTRCPTCKIECGSMNSPPFPIVSSKPTINDNWYTTTSFGNLEALLQELVPALCDCSASPTAKPSKAPTLAPTNPPTAVLPAKSPTRRPSSLAPTHAPSSAFVIDGIDVYLILDNSRSQTYPDAVNQCKHAPGVTISDPNPKIPCWALYLQFTSALVRNISAIPGPGGKPIGWMDDHPGNPNLGIRVWVYGFSCKDNQQVPLSFDIALGVTNFADFQAKLDAAMALVPFGGTCPSEAMQKTIQDIMSNNRVLRPNVAAYMLTDGVWYEGSAREVPQVGGIDYKIASGINSFHVATYSLGIALGLDPEAVKAQKSQLLNFAGKDPLRFFNLGVKGFQLLMPLIPSLVQRLQIDFQQFQVDPVYAWCGWSTKTFCTTGVAAPYCKWLNGNCYFKTFCGFGRDMCKMDSCCKWNPFPAQKCTNSPTCTGAPTPAFG